MTKRVSIANMQVAQSLYNFIESKVLPGTDINSKKFWLGFSSLVSELSPKNKSLLATRQHLQEEINQYHLAHQGENFEFSDYKAFLKEIGYLVPEVPDFTISTAHVDDELATMAGPQLVVPVMNARFALNAVNARWGSLYDALYGSDVINEDNGAEKSKHYNPARGAKVVEFARDFLDQSLPLNNGSHKDATKYQIINSTLTITLVNAQQTQLKSPELLTGFNGTTTSPSELLFKHNGLLFTIEFNADSPIAKTDTAGISDISIESALTTIMDCEDSVAAVDADDKVIAYKNLVRTESRYFIGNVREGWQQCNA